MNALIERLLVSGPVLTDGAWGTQLQLLGLGVGEFPDEWNASRPHAVEAVARSYVEAGSRVILTNTFGANRFRLAAHGLEARVEELNRLGVEISRRAAGDRARVFASIGPSGELLVGGGVTVHELAEAFGEQAAALAAAGADALVIETMADPAEACLAIAAARATGLPVAACLVFEAGREGDRTMMGTTVEEAVAALVAAGADVIGANCGQGIEKFIPICRRMRAATERPLWMKPNAGLPRWVEGGAVYDVSAERFAAQVPALLEAGASFVGGCCGTGPDFVARLARTDLGRAGE